MIEWLKRWLFKRENESKREWAEYDARCEKQRIAEAERAAEAKAEWETRNELEKKLDACYLGTRRQAFYGTYEEYLEMGRQQRYAQLASLQGVGALQQQATQMQNNGMRHQYQNPFFGSILG